LTTSGLPESLKPSAGPVILPLIMAWISCQTVWNSWMVISPVPKYLKKAGTAWNPPARTEEHIRIGEANASALDVVHVYKSEASSFRMASNCSLVMRIGRSQNVL
jgi:hypothetical protein